MRIRSRRTGNCSRRSNRYLSKKKDCKGNCSAGLHTICTDRNRTWDRKKKYREKYGNVFEKAKENS